MLELILLSNCWILSIVGKTEWKDVYPLYVVLYGGCPPASITATLALVWSARQNELSFDVFL